MSEVSLAGVRKIHVVGIGGPGMSALARVLAEMGHLVTGSDIRDSVVIENLRDAGIEVRIGHAPANVGDAEILVFPTGLPEGNVELESARRSGVEVVHRSTLLAAVCAAGRSVGVAGTHGKTTTSALLVHILVTAGTPASWSIGADPRGGLASSHWDRDPSADVFVVEADESDGTHAVLPLWGAILTNIDKDHLDHFGSVDAITDSFAGFLGRLDGPVVACGDDERIAEAIARGLQGRRASRYGTGRGNDFVLGEVRTAPSGISFSVAHAGRSHAVDLPLHGVHNALNCTAAMAMALELDVPLETSAAAVSGFAGVERRLEHLGTVSGAEIYDDYAHVPAEIEATLAALRARHPGKRVLAVFQPNRYHRIAAMHADYAGCFGAADSVVITDIYPSGTAPIPGVTGQLVADAVAGVRDAVIWAPTRDDVTAAVLESLDENVVCVGMGCGDIATLHRDLLERSGRGGSSTSVDAGNVEGDGISR